HSSQCRRTILGCRRPHSRRSPLSTNLELAALEQICHDPPAISSQDGNVCYLNAEKPMARIAIENYRPPTTATDAQYRHLETGDILFFPKSPWPLSAEDRTFLLGQKQVGTSIHKNVSYRPAQDCLTGIDQHDSAARKRTHEIMRSFSERSVEFMRTF